jgi:Tol biopolymer transport system component
VDPVFSIVSSKKKVVVTLRSGAATVTGKDPKKGVVVGLTASKGKQKVQVVTIPVGGNPSEPKLVATPTTPINPMIAALESKVSKPKPDTKPPVTTLTVRPENPSARTEFPFEFSSDRGALFSCSLNGAPYHACTSGQKVLVGPGLNTFSVEATDPAGNTGPQQSYTWYTERSPSAPIVFMSDRTGKYLLYTINPDGTNLTPLTTASGFDPAWSPDGKKIAFESDRDQPKGSEIYVLTLADGSTQRLTTNPANDRTPKWSPDGKFIVFASDRSGGKYQIYKMAADGSSGNKPTQLTSGAENSDPSWSTDGTSIAFESTRDGNNEIYVMSADGTHETRLTKNAFGDFNPSWSPDGKQIVFESDRNRNSEIYLMDANGMNQQRLTFNKARDSNPTFSPDGSRIAWSSNRAGPVDIWVAALKGNGPKRLAFGGKNNLAPSW